ncbi:MAG: hypothetical protein ACI8WB_002712 [Phenylobacterium sp.]|jgi:hypothetical protein
MKSEHVVEDLRKQTKSDHRITDNHEARHLPSLRGCVISSWDIED